MCFVPLEKGPEGSENCRLPIFLWFAFDLHKFAVIVNSLSPVVERNQNCWLSKLHMALGSLNLSTISLDHCHHEIAKSEPQITAAVLSLVEVGQRMCFIMKSKKLWFFTSHQAAYWSWIKMMDEKSVQICIIVIVPWNFDWFFWFDFVNDQFQVK